MIAETIPNAIVLSGIFTIENTLILETECRDYDHYRTLPNAVTFKGTNCGKTGWNSDTQRACYKSSAYLAYPIG